MYDAQDSPANPAPRLPRSTRDVVLGDVARSLVGFLVLSAGIARAAPLPILASNVTLNSTATVQAYSVDLGTLPARPILRVIATPDQADETMQLEITAVSWHGMPEAPGTCQGPSSVFTSTSGPGPATLALSLFGCDPRPGAFEGASVSIRIRALHFGSGSAPAQISVEIRGETRPPTATLTQQVDTTLAPTQRTFSPTRDTVIYEDDPDTSNGAGQFLWAGEQVSGVLFPVPTQRRSLLAFDVSPAIPPAVTVDAARLELFATSVLDIGGLVSLRRVSPDGVAIWGEGTGDAIGSEFVGPSAPSAGAASWTHRLTDSLAWSTPGGDTLGGTLASQTMSTIGSKIMSTSALADAVQDMVDTGADHDGFLLVGPRAVTDSRAVQFASSEHSTVPARPRLVVDFTPMEPYETGQISTSVVTFINEGQNFRWIYDLDLDNVYVTSINGVCEVTDLSSPRSLPYTYHYQGVPGFTGIDCCTWRIEDAQTGVVGSGQALFFHNVDASNPANMPPDTDADGIRDLCDNCPTVANGPLHGACRSGPVVRSPCRSHADCGVNGFCSLSQEDINGDFVGDVCVPEPTFAVGLGAGLLLLTATVRLSTLPRDSAFERHARR